MSVYKPKNRKTYYADFQVDGNRVHRSTGKTVRAAAERVAERWRAKLEQEIDAPPEPARKRMTLDEAAGTYWHNTGQHEKAHKTTDYQIANLIRLIGGDKQVDEIGNLDVETFIAWRRGEPHRRHRKDVRLVSNATVNREVELLKRILNRAAGWGVQIQRIEWKGLRLKEPRGRVRELTVEEEARLRAEATDYLVAPILCALWTGLRRSNVEKLDWTQVDLKAARITVTVKGDKELKLPISPHLRALLIAQGPKKKGAVFRRNGKPLGNTKTAWRLSLKRAGITDFRWHDLRHTAASRMVREGADIAVVQEALGHSDISTTRRYVHVRKEAVAEALAKISTPHIVPTESDEVAASD